MDSYTEYSVTGMKQTLTYISTDMSAGLYPIINPRKITATLSNEATHTIEQGKLNSIEEFKDRYDPDKSADVISYAENGVCTKRAVQNEHSAENEVLSEQEQYRDMTDDELDKIIFTLPGKDEKEENGNK